MWTARIQLLPNHNDRHMCELYTWCWGPSLSLCGNQPVPEPEVQASGVARGSTLTSVAGLTEWIQLSRVQAGGGKQEGGQTPAPYAAVLSMVPVFCGSASL